MLKNTKRWGIGDGIIVLVTILALLDAYAVGIISSFDKTSKIKIVDGLFIDFTTQVNNSEIEKGVDDILASKNGTKYYLKTCSGANRIKEENKVYFSSVEEAELAGYGPAANCF